MFFIEIGSTQKNLIDGSVWRLQTDSVVGENKFKKRYLAEFDAIVGRGGLLRHHNDTTVIAVLAERFRASQGGSSCEQQSLLRIAFFINIRKIFITPDGEMR